MGKLLLFDIDGTLVDTGGAGMRALQQACAQVFGDHGPALDLAGSTDAGILLEMLNHFGHLPELADSHQFYRVYLDHLAVNLDSGQFGGRVLPGVADLLAALAATGGFHLGLLTGNIHAGARVKMRHFQLDHYFPVGAFGDDHHDRNRLGPIALRRASGHFGQRFEPSDVWVIGDTPKDIACARALGSPCLAVATGRFSSAELTAAGATAVADNLADTAEIARLLG